MLAPRWLVPLLAGLLVVAVAVAAYFGWSRYRERHVVTRTETGETVTQVVAARLSSTSRLKVAELSGTIQSTAEDVRGFGLLRTGQVAKMPFSVDYFVDVSQIGRNDLQWVPQSRTLIVNAPDVVAGEANVREDLRSLIETSGIYVTREAGEALARQVSARATARARAEAQSPERMAQARESARRALARLLGAPLEASGQRGAQVIVTFPAERSDPSRERWDVTRPVEEVLANRS